jgi:23S rRNA pseudouridine2605 synthase
MLPDAPGGAADDRPLWEQLHDEGERLQKLLARVGFGSRRVCEDMIAAGRVTVNGETAVLGRRVRADSDEVKVDGIPVGVAPGLVYFLLNKPTGVVSTAVDTHDRQTVVDLVPGGVRVHPVGRLDMDTSGLIILTNDGALTNAVTHPSMGVEKEYLAEVECPPSGVPNGALRRLREGIELDDGPTSPALVSQPSPGVLRIVIHEGRNRQVRRMCGAVGHPVLRLARVRIGTVVDQSLSPGQWRELTLAEVRDLTASAGKTLGSRLRR